MTVRGLVPFALLAVLTATSAAGSEAVDRICTPDELPSVTQPQREPTRAFAPVEIRATPSAAEALQMPPGAMEVVVARINADGKVELSCVDTEAAARAFFTKLAKQKREVEEK